MLSLPKNGPAPLDSEGEQTCGLVCVQRRGVANGQAQRAGAGPTKLRTGEGYGKWILKTKKN